MIKTFKANPQNTPQSYQKMTQTLEIPSYHSDTEHLSDNQDKNIKR